MHTYCGLVISPQKIAMCIGTSAQPESEWTSALLTKIDEIWFRLEPHSETLEWVFVEGKEIGGVCEELQAHGLDVVPLDTRNVKEDDKPNLSVEQRAVELAAMGAKAKPRWPSAPWRLWQPYFLLLPLLAAFTIDHLDPEWRLRLLFVGAPLLIGPLLYIAIWLHKNPARLPKFYHLIIAPHPAEEPGYQPVVPRGCLSAAWPVAAFLLVLISYFSAIQGVFADLLFCVGLAILGGWLSVRLGKEIRQAALPITMAGLFSLILQADQSVEVLRTVNESPLYVRLVVYFAWLILISLLSQILLQLTWRILALGVDAVLVRKQRVVTALIVVLPYAAAIVSVWKSLNFSGSKYLPNFDGVVFLFILLATVLASIHVFFSRNVPYPRPSIGQMLVVTIFTFLPIFEFGDTAREIGYNVEPSAVLLLTGWFAITTTSFYLAGKVGRILGVPAILFLLIWTLILSALDLNNNHELSFARTHWQPPLASDAFDRWLSRFDEAPSPTAFIVVSEGGGARAEYMTAVVLEALRTRCADFNFRHFATIGVSGGSVGAAVSAVSPPSSASSCDQIGVFKASKSDAVDAAGIDLLGPALRGFLLKDLPFLLWPNSLWLTQGKASPDKVIRTGGDRSQYMEEAIGRIFLRQAKPTWESVLLFSGVMLEDERHKAVRPQDRLFSSVWDGPNGNMPGLILLTTDVATGRRVAASHFRFTVTSPEFEDCLPQVTGALDPGEGHLLSFDDVMPGREPTLMGAALASARFPIISPPAVLPCTGPPWRLVDGGYFENSGLTTALELVEHMATGAKQHGLASKKVHVVLIRVENTAAITERPSTLGKKDPPSAFSELLSPIRAFGGTREARAELSRLSVDQAVARGSYGTGCGNEGGACVTLSQVVLRLGPCEVPIPLGWSLSEGAKAEIRQQLGIETTSSDCVEKISAHNRDEFERIFELSKH
jgi:hypothetical protein